MYVVCIIYNNVTRMTHIYILVQTQKMMTRNKIHVQAPFVRLCVYILYIAEPAVWDRGSQMKLKLELLKVEFAVGCVYYIYNVTLMTYIYWK